MKKIYLFLSLVLCLTSNLFAQNEMTVALKLQGTSSYEAVNVGGIWSGVVGESQVIVNLNITPRAAGLSPDQLSEERFKECIVNRYYNDTEVAVSGLEDSFLPIVGVNQNTKYVANFIFERRTRSSVESEWGEWIVQAPEVENRVSSQFNVYLEPKDAVITKSSPNTFVNGPSREFSVSINGQSGNTDGWNVDWKLDGISVSNNLIYTYDPASAVEGNKKLSITVYNRAPDNSTVWYSYSESVDLNVFLNPVNVNPQYTFPLGKANASCIGRECAREYSVNIGDDAKNGRYGKWIYKWIRNNEVVSETDNANIDGTVGEGVYNTSLSLTCVNPNDENDIWLVVETPEFATYTVYSSPQAPGISKPEKKFVIANHSYENFVFEENHTGNPNGWTNKWNGSESDTYIVDVSSPTLPNYLNIVGEWKNVNPLDPTEIWLEGSESFQVYVCPEFTPELSAPSNFVVTVDSISVFKINTSIVSTPVGWTWDYSWRSSTQQGEIGNSSNLNYSATNDAGQKPIISYRVVGKTDDGDVWYDSDYLPAATLTVYEKPVYDEIDVHFNGADADHRKYEMYLGQTFHADKLYQANGGFDGGWNGTITIAGNVLENMSFCPSTAGTYSLVLSVVNNATLSTGEKKTWYDNGAITYEIKVLDKPEVATNLSNLDGFEDLHLISGENVVINVNPVGGDTNSWEASWTLKSSDPTSEEESGTTFIFDKVLENKTLSESVEYTVKYTITNEPKNIVDGFQYSESFEKNFIVWHSIIANIEKLVLRDDNFYVMETCEGLWTNNKERIFLNSVGGNVNKWSVKWSPKEGTPSETINPVVQDGRKFYTDFGNLAAEGTLSKEYSYTVDADYNINGSHPKHYSYNVTIITWPKPEINNVKIVLKDKPETKTYNVKYEIKDSGIAGVKDVNINNFNKDEVQVTYTITGGKSDKSGLWSVIYDNVESVIPYTPAASMSHNVTKSIISNYSGSAEIFRTEHKLKVSHKYDGPYYSSKNVWYESDLYDMSFKIYDNPVLTAELNDSSEVIRWGTERVDVYAGGYDSNKVDMTYSNSKGVQSGWTYDWIIDGITHRGTIGHWVYTPTSISAYEDKVISVHVVNGLPDGNKGIDVTYEYPIRVWRKAEFSKSFTLCDANQNDRNISEGVHAVRAGNTIKGSVSDIQYGYNNNYSYIWSGAHNGLNETAWSDIAGISSSESKDYENSTYYLLMNNVGPYEHVWDKVNLSQDVVVYNKPQTPNSIVQKGNGTSRTMIATADISDKDLEGKDYYLVFGYTDNNGVDHDFASQRQKGPGQVRWSKPFANQNQMSSAYVYAVWKYDNAEITSGKRMLKNSSESYDTSTYDGGTRSALGGDETTCVNEITKETHDHSEVLNVYTTNGVRIGSTLAGLKAGLYIVEFAGGVTKKMVVK